jgi:hypothetical protein
MGSSFIYAWENNEFYIVNISGEKSKPGASPVPHTKLLQGSR